MLDHNLGAALFQPSGIFFDWATSFFSPFLKSFFLVHSIWRMLNSYWNRFYSHSSKTRIELGRGEGGERLPLARDHLCKMWGMCTASCCTSCLSPADNVRPLHLGVWNLNDYGWHDELQGPVHFSVLRFLHARGIIKGLWSKPWSRLSSTGRYIYILFIYLFSFLCLKSLV